MRKAFRAAALAAVVAFIALLAVGLLLALLTPPEQVGGRRAIVIDALYEWMPNDDLLNFITRALKGAGYEVLVVRGKEATVDALRNLTQYSVVIIRCHGAHLKPGEVLRGRVLKDYVPVAFTGEPFSECLPFSCKYYLERLGDEVIRGDFNVGGRAVSVFALTPIFFERLRGRFSEGTVFVYASCYGLSGRALADAVLGKGAELFIAWDWNVSLEYVDRGLRMLVEEAVVRGRGWLEAARRVSSELGPDPVGRGVLEVVRRS